MFLCLETDVFLSPPSGMFSETVKKLSYLMLLPHILKLMFYNLFLLCATVAFPT